MKYFSFKRFVSMLLVLVLLAAAALATVACEKDQTESPELSEKTFTFVAVMKDGTERTEMITTTQKTVGAALLEKGLIAGEDGPYGLYVKTVFGETLDYDTDGMYWAFYIGDAYASTGVDVTNIEDGATYTMKAE